METIPLASMYLVSTTFLAAAILLHTLLTLFGRRDPLHPANLAYWYSVNPWSFIGDVFGMVVAFAGYPVSVEPAMTSWGIKTTSYWDAFFFASTPNVASNRVFIASSILYVGAVAVGNVPLFWLVAPAGYSFSKYEAANKYSNDGLTYLFLSSVHVSATTSIFMRSPHGVLSCQIVHFPSASGNIGVFGWNRSATTSVSGMEYNLKKFSGPAKCSVMPAVSAGVCFALPHS